MIPVTVELRRRRARHRKIWAGIDHNDPPMLETRHGKEK
jgi:hypothetical protein